MSIIKKIIKSDIMRQIFALLAYLYIKFVLLTSKKDVIYNNFDFSEYEYRQLIFATWHGRVVIMPIVNPSKLNSCAIVSDHKDGRLIGAVIANAGVELIFGSSNRRRISALKEIITNIKKGKNFLITPDGPRGPSRIVNGAVINIASTSSLAIVPSSFSAKRVKIFKTWDQFMLPLPFNHITIIFDKPIDVPRELKQEKKDEYKNILTNRLNNITNIADKKYESNRKS